MENDLLLRGFTHLIIIVFFGACGYGILKFADYLKSKFLKIEYQWYKRWIIKLLIMPFELFGIVFFGLSIGILLGGIIKILTSLTTSI